MRGNGENIQLDPGVLHHVCTSGAGVAAVFSQPGIVSARIGVLVDSGSQLLEPGAGEDQARGTGSASMYNRKRPAMFM